MVGGVAGAPATCVAPCAGANLALADNAQRLFVGTRRRNGQREFPGSLREHRCRLHRIIAGGHQTIHQARVVADAAIVALGAVAKPLAVPPQTAMEEEVGPRVLAGQIDGYQGRLGHVEGVEPRVAIVEHQRAAILVPLANRLRDASGVAEGNLATRMHGCVGSFDRPDSLVIGGEYGDKGGRQRDAEDGATKE